MKKLICSAIFVSLTAACFAATGIVRPLTTDMRAIYGATDRITITHDALDGVTTTNESLTITYRIPSNTWFEFVGAEVVTPLSGALATNQIIGDATWTFGTEDSAAAFMSARQCGTNTTVWRYATVPTLSATPLTTTLAYAGPTNPTVTMSDKQITINYAGPTNPTVTLSLGTVLVTNVNWVTASGAAFSNIFLMVTSATATATIPFGESVVSTGATATATIPFGSTVVATNSTVAAAIETYYAAATNLMVTITPAEGQALSWAERGDLNLYLKMHTIRPRR
jgi:hypothetical protein